MPTTVKKETIIDAALSIFIKQGYAGASVRQIAKTANVTKGLIYHHFKSKEELWTCVKKYCVEQAQKSTKPIRDDTLENFVNDLIEARFAVYAKDSMRMLIHWQSLEPTTYQFYDKTDIIAPLFFDLPQQIQQLQQKGIVRKDEDHQALAAIVFSLLSYAFFDFSNAYQLSEEQHDLYKKMTSQILIKTLNPTGSDDA